MDFDPLENPYTVQTTLHLTNPRPCNDTVVVDCYMDDESYQKLLEDSRSNKNEYYNDMEEYSPYVEGWHYQ